MCFAEESQPNILEKIGALRGGTTYGFYEDDEWFAEDLQTWVSQEKRNHNLISLRR